MADQISSNINCYIKLNVTQNAKNIDITTGVESGDYVTVVFEQYDSVLRSMSISCASSGNISAERLAEAGFNLNKQIDVMLANYTSIVGKTWLKLVYYTGDAQGGVGTNYYDAYTQCGPERDSDTRDTITLSEFDYIVQSNALTITKESDESKYYIMSYQLQPESTYGKFVTESAPTTSIDFEVAGQTMHIADSTDTLYMFQVPRRHEYIKSVEESSTSNACVHVKVTYTYYIEGTETPVGTYTIEDKYSLLIYPVEDIVTLEGGGITPCRGRTYRLSYPAVISNVPITNRFETFSTNTTNNYSSGEILTVEQSGYGCFILKYLTLEGEYRTLSTEEFTLNDDYRVAVKVKDENDNDKYVWGKAFVKTDGGYKPVKHMYNKIRNKYKGV